MNGWVPAAQTHRALLNSFICVERGPARGPGTWYVQHKPWAQKAQSLIRAAEAPSRPPDQTSLYISGDGARVEAAYSFYPLVPSDGIQRFHLNVLARHLDCARAGFGALAYEQFLEECTAIIEAGPRVSAALFTAEVHIDNLPVLKFLSERRWRRVSEPGSDGYANWSLNVEIT